MKIREYELRTSPAYRRKSLGRRSEKLRRIFSFGRNLSDSPTKQIKISRANRDDLLTASSLVRESQTVVAAALMGSLRGNNLLFSSDAGQNSNYFSKSSLSSVRETVDDCYVTLRPVRTSAVSLNSLNLNSTPNVKSKMSPARKHAGLVSFIKVARRGNAVSAFGKLRRRSKASEIAGCEDILARKNGEISIADKENSGDIKAHSSKRQISSRREPHMVNSQDENSEPTNKNSLRRRSLSNLIAPTNIIKGFTKNQSEDLSPRTTKDQLTLEIVLSRKAYLQEFKQFLVKEVSDENLDFWLECEAYKDAKIDKQPKLAQKIFEKYIAHGSPKEINVDGFVKEDIRIRMNRPCKDIFVPAQNHVLILMRNDPFPRFLLTVT